MVEGLCGAEDNAEVPSVLKLYVDLASVLLSRRVKQFRTSAILYELEDGIRKFNRKTMNLFENYQAS